MSKKSMIRIAFAVAIALIIIIFYLLSKTDKSEWITALILTFFIGEAYLLLPKKWFDKFKKKEKNPLID